MKTCHRLFRFHTAIIEIEILLEKFPFAFFFNAINLIKPDLEVKLN